MNKKLLVLIVIGLVFLVERVCYNLQFSIPDLEFTVPKEEKKYIYSNAKEYSQMNYKCSELRGSDTYEVSFQLNFEYPVFRFDGLCTVGEEFVVGGKIIYRTIYVSEDFKKEFTIKGICYPKEIGKEIKTAFSFITKEGDVYSWNLIFDSNIIRQKTLLKVFLPVKHDTYKSVDAQLIE